MHCLDAQMQLRDLPLSTRVRDEAHVETLAHYANCVTCRPLGYAAIRRETISCEDAIAVCLQGDCLLFDASRCETLRDLLAHEHVFGRSVVGQQGQLVSARGSPVVTGCGCPVCEQVRNIWFNAKLCSHYDGDDEKRHGAEWTLDIATRAGWNTEPLWDSLRARWHTLSQCAKTASATAETLWDWQNEMGGISEAFANYKRAAMLQ